MRGGRSLLVFSLDPLLHPVAQAERVGAGVLLANERPGALILQARRPIRPTKAGGNQNSARIGPL